MLIRKSLRASLSAVLVASLLFFVQSSNAFAQCATADHNGNFKIHALDLGRPQKVEIYFFDSIRTLPAPAPPAGNGDLGEPGDIPLGGDPPPGDTPSLGTYQYRVFSWNDHPSFPPKTLRLGGHLVTDPTLPVHYLSKLFQNNVTRGQWKFVPDTVDLDTVNVGPGVQFDPTLAKALVWLPNETYASDGAPAAKPNNINVALCKVFGNHRLGLAANQFEAHLQFGYSNASPDAITVEIQRSSPDHPDVNFNLITTTLAARSAGVKTIHCGQFDEDILSDAPGWFPDFMDFEVTWWVGDDVDNKHSFDARVGFHKTTFSD